MRLVLAAFAAATLAATSAAAQAPAAPRAPAVADPTVAPRMAIEQLIAQAKAQRREGQPLVSLLLAQGPGYVNRVDYRASVGPANLHLSENELFYVLEGAATLVTGGTLIEPTPPRNGNQNGARIDGGTAKDVEAGDMLFVAAGTPHWFQTVSELVVLSIHTPAAAP